MTQLFHDEAENNIIINEMFQKLVESSKLKSKCCFKELTNYKIESGLYSNSVGCYSFIVSYSCGKTGVSAKIGLSFPATTMFNSLYGIVIETENWNEVQRDDQKRV